MAKRRSAKEEAAGDEKTTGGELRPMKGKMTGDDGRIGGPNLVLFIILEVEIEKTLASDHLAHEVKLWLAPSLGAGSRRRRGMPGRRTHTRLLVGAG
jgi:hypothetical protein